MWLAGAVLVSTIGIVWALRIGHPFDLEWTEGGWLAHGARLAAGQPLYVEPGPAFVPFAEMPGYPALLAFGGTVTGLSPTLGRALSIVGTGLAAGAMVFAMRSLGSPSVVAFGTVATWLATYAATGASFDLVRPDAVGLAAVAWAVALSLRPAPGGAVAAGLLLALAVLVRGPLAAVGLPLGLAWAWHGRGLRFVAAAGGPVAVVGGMLVGRTDGRFLTYVLDVPAVQPAVWAHATWDTPRVWASLAVPLLGLATVVLLAALKGRGPWPRWTVAGVPVWSGCLAAFAATVPPAPAGAGAVGLTVGAGVSLAAAGGFAVVAWATRRLTVPVEVLIVGAVAFTAGVGAIWLRLPQGADDAVHLPALWAVVLAWGRVVASWPPVVGRGLLVGSIVWAGLGWPPEGLVPTPEDRRTRERFVAALEGEGPVLSPFAAWLPTHAGHPPSLHAKAVWAVQAPGSPWSVDGVAEAIEGRRWRVVVGGNAPLIDDRPFADRYLAQPLVVTPRTGPGRPRSGAPVMPIRVLLRDQPPTDVIAPSKGRNDAN